MDLSRVTPGCALLAEGGGFQFSFEGSASQPGATLFPEECWAMSGDASGFHKGRRSGWVGAEARDAAGHAPRTGQRITHPNRLMPRVLALGAC